MSKLVKFTGFLAVAVFAAAQSQATLLVSDSFTYPNGALTNVSGGAWVAYSGAVTSPNNVSNDMDVVTDVNAQDVGLSIGADAHSNDVLYAGFDVDQTTMTATAPSYFAHFKDSTTFDFFGRTWVSNSGPGTVVFGIANGAGVPVFSSTPVATGTWSRLVLEIDQTGPSMVCSLYIGPTNDSNMADFTLLTATDIPSLTNVNFSAFALRQASTSTGAGTEFVDNLDVGTTFGDVVVPEPSTVLLVGAGLMGLLAVRRRRQS